MKENRLYKVRTQVYKEFYVVASSFEEAEILTMKRLKEADYGFTDDRLIVNVELLGIECFYSKNEKQSFNGEKYNLIVKKENEV